MMFSGPTRPSAPQVLLVEDAPGDVYLTKRAWNLSGFAKLGDLHVVNDGDKAVQFIRQQGEFHDAPRPHLILLDLNLPRRDGREVLRAIKDDPKYRRIPVVVLTSSTAETDLLQAHDLGCNSYLQKPVTARALADLMQKVHEWWFTTAWVPVR